MALVRALAAATARAVRGAAAHRVARRAGVHTSAPVLKWFDRLIPEDDPETKAKKELEARAIKRRLTRSKLAEMSLAKDEKLFVATPDLLERTGDKPPFEDFSVVPLDGGAYGANAPATLQIPQALHAGAATLMTVAFQAIGQKQLAPWQEAFAAAFQPASLLDGAREPPSKPRMVNVVYLEGWFFSALQGVFKRSVHQGTPVHLRPYGAMVTEARAQKSDHFCERLDIHNRVMGHVFLLDKDGYVRWRAHADPADGELEAMVTATRALAEAKAHNKRPVPKAPAAAAAGAGTGAAATTP